MNNKLNGNRTTSEHKQECKEIYIILFNKYKGLFNFMQTADEKQKLFFNYCAKDVEYKNLTNEEQTKLYTRLLSVT